MTDMNTELEQSNDEHKPKNGAVLMLQGTASDVGKSIVTTALCRIFLQDGYQPAPYKSQNMALNSYVTLDGKEIGRAQGVQAEACEIPATTDMNPILIKPVKDMHSQIVVHGVPAMQMSAMDYRMKFLPTAKRIVLEALDRLRAEYDIVLMEGAGSPAEINLKDRDIVNMNLAGWADAPVILISDIDRGGVFASIVGTLELLEPHEVQRIKGFIINKFRGDLALLKPGLDWLEARTGIPVLGVLPYIQDLRIEAEDSVVLDELQYKKQQEKEVDIVVIRYPRISNFTDFDPLRWEPDITLRYVNSAEELGTPDIVILPGTKDTISDLQFLKQRGLDHALYRLLEKHHTQIVGICGGYQMLGYSLSDPYAVESGVQEEAGLGLLPIRTSFLKEKRTIRVIGMLTDGQRLPLASTDPTSNEAPIEAYEIHMGVSERLDQDQVNYSYDELFRLTETDTAASDLQASFDSCTYASSHSEGLVRSDGMVWGTYLHGLFENDALRRSWLDQVRIRKGLSPVISTFSAKERKVEEFDRVADVVRTNLDMEKIYQILNS